MTSHGFGGREFRRSLAACSILGCPVGRQSDVSVGHSPPTAWLGLEEPLPSGLVPWLTGRSGTWASPRSCLSIPPEPGCATRRPRGTLRCCDPVTGVTRQHFRGIPLGRHLRRPLFMSEGTAQRQEHLEVRITAGHSGGQLPRPLSKPTTGCNHSARAKRVQNPKPKRLGLSPGPLNVAGPVGPQPFWSSLRLPCLSPTVNSYSTSKTQTKCYFPHKAVCFSSCGRGQRAVKGPYGAECDRRDGRTVMCHVTTFWPRTGLIDGGVPVRL